ncbi:hypothetical protein Hanom_Chr17g01556501 [Helianthus anomalus]
MKTRTPTYIETNKTKYKQLLITIKTACRSLCALEALWDLLSTVVKQQAQ